MQYFLFHRYFWHFQSLFDVRETYINQFGKLAKVYIWENCFFERNLGKSSSINLFVLHSVTEKLRSCFCQTLCPAVVHILSSFFLLLMLFSHSPFPHTQSLFVLSAFSGKAVLFSFFFLYTVTSYCKKKLLFLVARPLRPYHTPSPRA